ncbi:jg24720, partial [Pararge aegeria aegeria]
PPDILDYPTSSDQVAREGANVTLRCAAHGVPTPAVVWRKEAGDLLPTLNFTDNHSKKVIFLLEISIIILLRTFLSLAVATYNSTHENVPPSNLTFRYDVYG